VSGLPALIPSAFELPALIPGTAGAPGGPGGPASPGQGSGWSVLVRAAPDYSVLLCQIPRYMSLQFSKILKDKGAGTIVLNLDDPWFADVTLADGQPASTLFDEEHLWQVTQDGIVRFEFFAETITEQLADASEQRTVTVTGPGTIAALSWAAAMPPGFPDIIYKTDAIQDGFAEINEEGNLQVDTSIWNVISPAADVTLNPSGTLQIMASPGTTYCGATPYDITSSLFSAQITPVGGSAASLDGSQLTQMYVQDTASDGNYALIGLSSTGLYCQVGDTAARTVQTKELGAYDASSQLYWQISEDKGIFYFWTSADGTTFTQEWSAAHEWAADSITVYFAAKYDAASSQLMAVTNVNGNVITPTSAGNIYFGEPIMGVWYSIFQDAQARGTIPFVVTAMTGTADSFGNAWTDSNSVQIQNGTDLYSLLQSHTAIVNADYIMQPGFVLQVALPQAETYGTGSGIVLDASGSPVLDSAGAFVTDTSSRLAAGAAPAPIGLGFDRSQQVIFHEGGQIQERQRVRDRSQIANLDGAVNSDGTTISASDAASISSWGQREGWVQTAVQVNPASIAIAAQASVEETADEILSWTLTVLPDAGGSTCFRDYNVGDWVGLERPGPGPGGPDYSGSVIDAVRVMAIAVSIDATGLVTCELTVSSYLQWLQEQLLYLVNKMGGQFINSLGTTPVTSSASGPAQLPTIFAPSLSGLGDTLTVGTTHGSPLVYNAVTGAWQPAATPNTANQDLTPVSVIAAGGNLIITPSASDPATLSITNSAGAAQVVAGQQADGSVTVTTQNTGPPAVPDTPVASGGILGIYVAWDGLLQSAPPLASFAYCQVHVSASSGFTPSSATLQGQMTGGGLFGVGGLTAGTAYYAKLVATSQSGEVSAPSTQASATAQAVASGIGAGAITTGMIGVGQVVGGPGGSIAEGSITATEIEAGTVLAGAVDGTTVTGATIVADGASGQFLVYSGTPAYGNLIAAISGAAGSDAQSNSYPANISALVIPAGQSETYTVTLGATAASSVLAGNIAGLVLQSQTNPIFAPPYVGIGGDNSTGSVIEVSSGHKSGATSNSITIRDSSQVLAGIYLNGFTVCTDGFNANNVTALNNVTTPLLNGQSLPGPQCAFLAAMSQMPDQGAINHSGWTGNELTIAQYINALAGAMQTANLMAGSGA